MIDIKKIYKPLALIVVFLLFSFTILHLTQDRELIIGEWVSTEDNNWKLVFNHQGKCYDYYQGKLESTYTYSISEETADNGVVFSYLKLVEVSDNDVLQYDINALDENNLALNFLGDLNEKLMLFEKQ